MRILTTMWYTPVLVSKEGDITSIVIDPESESDLTLHTKLPVSDKYHIRKGKTDPFQIPFVIYVLASKYEGKLVIYTAYTEKQMRSGDLDNGWCKFTNIHVSRQISLLSKIVFGKEGLFNE